MEPGSVVLSEGNPKVDSSLFDVFLCHNSKDKPSVRQLAGAMIQRGIKVWLDEWELIPGQDWQEALEEMIGTVHSAMVLVGEDGLGPWEIVEMRACINEFVRRKMPVIPVLLPNAKEPELPLFLKHLIWVDFRKGLIEEKIDLLIRGIPGARPVTKIPGRPSDEATQAAERSLNELKYLVRSSSVRGVEIHFTEEIRAVRDQVAKLRDYKELHDHLQEVELGCQNLVALQVRRSGQKRIDWELLCNAEITLQRIVGQLQDLQKDQHLPTSETTWIGDIHSMWIELQQAIKNRDPWLLKNTALRLDRLLRIELPQINTRLNEVARNLRLSTLVRVMKNAADNLSTLDYPQASIQNLKQGTDALLRLNQTLMSLIAQHDDWQRIDQELRLIEANINRDTQELEMAWPYVMHRVETLYDVITTDWVVLFTSDVRELDQAIITANPSFVRVCFRKFSGHVGNHFYRVDRQLKDLCENLRQIDGPLRSLFEENQ